MFTFTGKGISLSSVTVATVLEKCSDFGEKKNVVRQRSLLEASFHRFDDKAVEKKNYFPVTGEKGFIEHLCPPVLF